MPRVYADEETRKGRAFQRAERLERELAPRVWTTPSLSPDDLDILADAWEEADFLGWADNYRAEAKRRRTHVARIAARRHLPVLAPLRASAPLRSRDPDNARRDRQLAGAFVDAYQKGWTPEQTGRWFAADVRHIRGGTIDVPRVLRTALPLARTDREFGSWPAWLRYALATMAVSARVRKEDFAYVPSVNARRQRDAGSPRPTAEQRRFIGEKIRILRHEGRPQAQAIAIAYRMAGVPPRRSTR